MSAYSNRFRQIFHSAALLCAILAGLSAHGSTYHVSVNGDDSKTGLSPEAPFATVARALDVAQDGDTISIGEGTFSSTATLSITKGVIVRGAGIDRTILTTPQKETDRGYRTIYMNHPDAWLEGVTVSGGRAPWEYYYLGQGIFVDKAGGTVSRCRITGNCSTVFHTRGAVAIWSAAGRLLASVVDHNWGLTGSTQGGGVFVKDGALVENCLVFGNRSCDGGGIYVEGKGHIRNCTIYGNWAKRWGGGVFWSGVQAGNATMLNSIVSGNEAPNDMKSDGPGWGVNSTNILPALEAGISNCLFTDSPRLGTNSISGDPAFVDVAAEDFSLLPASVAIDGGVSYEGMAATDFGGAERIRNGTVDIGCLEFEATEITCGVRPSPAVLFEGGEVTLAPVLRGIEPSEGLTYRWTLRSEEGNEAEFSGETPSGLLPEAGWYDVTVTVSDGTGAIATHTRPRCIHVAARTNYLAPAGVSTPAYPWDTPETAANDLSTLLDEALEGTTILIAAGEYKLPEEVFLPSEITLRGAGIDETVFTVAAPKQGTRLFWMNHPRAVLEEMTLKGGCHHGDYNDVGNGVLIGLKGGVMRRCRVTECRSLDSYYHQGSVAILGADGLVTRCVIDHNTVLFDGSGGGVYVENGIVENSLILENTAGKSAGGAYVGTKGTVRNCTIVGNTAKKQFGGGIYVKYTSLKDSVTLRNNIVAGNSAVNDATAGSPEWGVERQETPGYLEMLQRDTDHCLFGLSAPLGAFCLTGEAGFVNAASHDYALLAGSQAIDYGVSYEGMASFDLAGASRVQNGRVDLGCYEFDVSDPSCGLTAGPTALFEGENVAFDSNAYGLGDPETLTYEWNLSNGQGAQFNLAGRKPVGEMEEAGWYDVTLTVRNGSGAFATQTRPRYIHVAARTNYLAPAGVSVPAYPWKTEGTAANDLDELLGEAIDGTVIVATEGEYELTGEIVLDTGISLVGAGIDRTVFRRAKDGAKRRLFTLNHPHALLAGVTVRGARHQGEYYDFGNGVWIGSLGGTLRDSRVTDCEAYQNFYHKGAVGVSGEHGLVTRCVIDSNRNKNGTGGGLAVQAGLAENCLVAGNWAQNGGGLYIGPAGTIRNCTVVGNETDGQGGGFYWDADKPATLMNVLFQGNLAPNDTGAGSPNWYAPNAQRTGQMEAGTVNCLFAEGPTMGIEARSGDPVFRDVRNGDYALLPGSAAIDAGTNYTGVAATDLTGAVRVQNGTIDIGCHEYDTSVLSCGFTATPSAFLEGGEVVLEATVYGAGEGADLSCAWTLESKEGIRIELEGARAAAVIPEAGWYDVTLTATDPSTGTHATLTRPAAVHVATPVMYLAEPGCSSPAYPWKTEATAANDISSLVDEAIDGCTLRVGEGAFPVTNEVSLTRAVRLVGAGIDRSVLFRGEEAMRRRLVYINHPDALLQGVTVKGSRHDGPNYDAGDGVLIAAQGGTMRACRVTASSAGPVHHRGAVGIEGVDGLVSGCIIDFNTNGYYGGVASSSGLYLEAGLAENCLVARNHLYDGSGGLLLDGEGVIRNCTFVDNVSTGKIESANGAGVVVLSRSGPGKIVNCIFAGNKATMVTTRTVGYPEWYVAKGEPDEIFLNCLFSDSVPVGLGAVTGDPLFKDPLAGDYSLSKGSPAHDKGVYESWMADAVDLAGNPRVDCKRRVDIGCYEMPYVPKGTLLQLR